MNRHIIPTDISSIADLRPGDRFTYQLPDELELYSADAELSYMMISTVPHIVAWDFSEGKVCNFTTLTNFPVFKWR